MAKRRQKASPNARSRWRRQSAASLLKLERQQRKEALERERATSEILRVIAESQADVQPVFDTIVRNAVTLCGGMDATAFRYDGEQLHLVATTTRSVELRKILAHMYPRRPDERQAAGRAIHAKGTIKIEDARADPAYDHGVAIAGSFRRVLAVPMLRGGEPIGVINVAWAKPGAVSKRQEQLLQTFADQAVIAIENVRLFNETKEALARQTATADVLRVISASPTDVQPVLNAVAERAARLCNAMYATVFLAEGDVLQRKAHCGQRQQVSGNVPISRSVVTGRAFIEKRIVHVEDIVPLLDAEYPGAIANQRRLGFRTILAVPMLLKGEPIGAIGVWRLEVRPFSEEEIGVLQTFADQAVIAIENARLFNETKEALEQQKAMAEVLAVISNSIADTKPVFDQILESCQRVFAGRNVGINVVGDDGQVYLGAYRGQARAELEAHFPVPLSMESGSGAAILQRQVVHYPDTESPDVPEYASRGGRIAGHKSFLIAPMLWEGTGVGAIFVGRPVIGPFSEKEIALLKTFADQAAIAIQNAKLFREIQEQSAQLEVVNRQLEVANKHKSDFLANMSHELRTPLNAIIGFSEALIDKLFGDLTDKQLEYQTDILQSGKHLLSLINDILDLSKIEAGRMELELSTFHLPTAVSNAVILIRERAMRHGIALGVEIDERLGEFEADERKVKQILLNLLSNAVKFTPDGGRVDVSAKLDTDKVEISVKDTGVGISPEDQASLFEEFKQLGKDSSRKAEGTGLGLALTKRLVELHGGQILVDSAVGKGSTFRVLLPARN